MFKKLLFALAFFTVASMYAQEEVLMFTNSAKTSSSDIKNIIPVVNKKNKHISVFLIDSKKVYAYLLNTNFETSKQFNTEYRNKKFEQLIGNSISEKGDHRLYFSNDNYSKFSSVNFSFANGSVTLQDINIELKKERFLETINNNNTFKLLTVSEKEPILNIYVFEDDANYKKHQIDFTNDTLTNAKNKKVTINELLEKVVKIEENNLNSIDLTSELSKLYVGNNELIFSLDQNKDSTQIIAVDLTTFEKQIRKLPKPFAVLSKKRKTNSYIADNFLFTIAATKDNFSFAIQDLRTGVLANKYELTSEDTITFKNSSMVQVGAVYKSYRELEKTKKFLQKITYGNVGISAHRLGDNYQLFLGGQHEYRATTGGMGMIKTPKGVTLFSGELLVAHFNPTLNAFNLYSNTKSTYIQSLVNTSFKHVVGNIKRNAFDKIKDSEKGNIESENLKTLFKYENDYLLGEYIMETNQFRLRRFKN